MHQPITSLSELKKKIEEIKKKDPKAQYTVQQLQERRQKRMQTNRQPISTLVPTSPIYPLNASVTPTDLASRNPTGAFVFKLNTEFYRNSIVLSKKENEQKSQVAPESKEDMKQGCVYEQLEPQKSLQKKNREQPNEQANSNQLEQSNKGLFMQLNPVVPVMVQQVGQKPTISNEPDKRQQNNLFQSSIPVKQQLGLLQTQNLAKKPSSSQITTKLTLFGSTIQKESTALFSNKQDGNQVIPVSDIFKQNNQCNSTGLFNSNISLFTFSSNSNKQDKKQSQAPLFGASLFGKESSTLFGQKKQISPGVLFGKPNKQPSQAQPSKEQQKETVKPSNELAPDNQEIKPRNLQNKEDEANRNKLNINLFGPGFLLQKQLQKQQNQLFTQQISKGKSRSLFTRSVPDLLKQEEHGKQAVQQPKNPLVPEKQIEQTVENVEVEASQPKLPQTNLFQSNSLFSQPEDKSSPKKKPEMAIGPGGKGFELIDSNSFFSGETKNKLAGTSLLFGKTAETNSQQSKPSGLFGGPSLNNSTFGQTYFNKAATGMGIFNSQSSPSIFGNTSTQNNSGQGQATNIFGEKTASQSTSLFGQGTLFSQKASGQGISLFNQTNSLFSQGPPSSQGTSIFGQGGSLFGQGNKAQQLQDKEDEEGEDDDQGPIEEVEDIDPTKSTGSYDYIQSNVIFKDTAVKFRQGSKQTLQNVTISLEAFPGGKSTYLFVRLANKCIALTGLLMPGTTEIRIINNSSRNLQIKKILCQNKKPPGLVLVKIQLKDQSIGSKLLQVVEKVLKNE